MFRILNDITDMDRLSSFIRLSYFIELSAIYEVVKEPYGNYWTN